MAFPRGKTPGIGCRIFCGVHPGCRKFGPAVSGQRTEKKKTQENGKKDLPMKIPEAATHGELLSFPGHLEKINGQVEEDRVSE
ncbi:hypothetical protein ACFL0O_08120 [Thermodesulfobacteriota bacterium]